MKSSMQVLTLVLVLVGTAFFLLACGDAPPKPLHFTSSLSGANEVPPNSSTASGLCDVVVNPAQTQLTYTLSVTNLNNPFMAHLHLAGPGVNGSIFVFFYGPTPPNSGLTTGTLATGTKTAADLIGPMAGHTIADVVNAMLSNGVYCNVHTSSTTILANQPGNIPGGEIRNQMTFQRQ